LIFLDESGVTTSMTRLYGRRRDGRRIHEAAPQDNWKILTILGAISTRGIIATMPLKKPRMPTFSLPIWIRFYVRHCALVTWW
jgi:hypothetical protein